MRDQHSLRDLLHWATHRIPGVPAHTERPAGHQGQARHSQAHQGQERHGQERHGQERHGQERHGQERHGHGWRHSPTRHPSHHHGFNHSPARPPRVLPAWQTRIARLFGQKLG